MKKIMKKYPCFFVLLVPRKRDDAGWVKSWTVLNTVRDVTDCEKAFEYYEREGFEGVVAISTYPDTEGDSNVLNPELPPRIVAKFYRVLWGMEGGGVSDKRCSCT